VLIIGILGYGKLDDEFVGEFFLTSTLQYSTIPLLHELGKFNNYFKNTFNINK